MGKACILEKLLNQLLLSFRLKEPNSRPQIYWRRRKKQLIVIFSVVYKNDTSLELSSGEKLWELGFFFPSSFPLPRQEWEITYFIKWQHMLCLRREKCMFNPTFLKYKWWHTEQGDRMYEFTRGQIQRFTVLFLCCLVYIEEHHWIFELKVNLEVT